LYDPAVLVTPDPAPVADASPREWEVRIKVEGEFSKIVYPFNPIDVIGWKGDLTAWKLNMRDIRPVMSHRAHLPPSAHTTFVRVGRWFAAFCRGLWSRMKTRCASRSTIATPITTSSSSITTAIFSAR
jgi:homogentisate 1,2-dioxygenase